jgi:aldehyde dehydrogenase (NAD+)
MESKTNIPFRKEALTKLLNAIIVHENEIIDALYFDFKKPAFETVITETSYVISDLKDTIKNLKRWSKPKRVFPSLLNFPSKDYIYKEPYGKVLIISPWKLRNNCLQNVGITSFLQEVFLWGKLLQKPQPKT